MYLGYYEKALNQLHSIESQVVSLNNIGNHIVLYLNIIDCYLKSNEIEKANNYLKNVQPLINITNDNDYKFNFELLNAQKYLLLNGTTERLDYFTRLQGSEWGEYNKNLAKIEEIKILQSYNSSLINEKKI